VPELDIVFFDFPAKVYFATVANVREINEPTVEILNLHT
jgi:hypothetical protein